jgi:hypothetical protein
MFLRVTTLTDKASGDGKQLMRELFNEHPMENKDKAQWKLQPNPEKGAWMIW